MASPASSLQPVKIKVDTENVKGKVKVVVVLEWTKDYQDWPAGKFDDGALEARRMPKQRLTLRAEVSSDTEELEWKPTWSLASEAESMKEIYAVIRAEHHFMVSGSWRKIACKTGVTGFDSLFKKGSTFLICESKASGDYGDFVRYLAAPAESDDDDEKTKGDFAVGRLSETERKPRHKKLLRKLTGTKQQPYVPKIIVQMSWKWVNIKVAEMLCRKQKKAGDKAAKAALRKKIGASVDAYIKSDEVERWYNYYGTDPFYRLPGEYKVALARKAEFIASGGQLTTVKKPMNWPPGDTILSAEFLHLDECAEFLKAANEKNENSEGL